MSEKRDWRHRLLHVDGIAALSAGILVLLLAAWLSELYDLPRSLLTFTGVVNVAYGCYSLPLALRARRPSGMITFLVIANGFWTVVCFVLASMYWKDASWLGLAHLVGEGLFVGRLAQLEWRWRELLQSFA